MSSDSLFDKKFDVIIIGAGVAGSALAYALGNDGRQVLLIERDLSEPDRIVGELLQPGGYLALESLGLAHCTSGIDAIDVFGYVIFNGEETCPLKYPIGKSGRTLIGKSFHHGRFIQKMRESCRTISNITILEATVTKVVTDPDSDNVIGVSCLKKLDSHLSSEPPELEFNFLAPLTVVADGCFSKFRKAYLGASPKTKSHFVGLVIEDCPLPFKNYGHVILADPSPILLYQIGTRDTRVLVDVPGKLPSTMGGGLSRYLEQFVAPQLPKPVQGSFVRSLVNQRIRTMPNSFLPPTLQRTPGLILIGDAQNMRHPLTGGGMTVALTDVVLLKSMLSKSELPSFQGRQQEIVDVCKAWFWRRKGLSGVVNVLAMALYDLFSAGDDPDLAILQRATFDYLNRGGRCTGDPVKILAGLLPSPFLLFAHFFSVAGYGAYDLFSREPIHKFPITIWRGLRALCMATKVMMPLIWSEIRGWRIVN